MLKHSNSVFRMNVVCNNTHSLPVSFCNSKHAVGMWSVGKIFLREHVAFIYQHLFRYILILNVSVQNENADLELVK